MKLYSNEIVFRGHPDKVCDQISGAILNACLKQDNHSRVGVECVGGKGKIFVTGEITTKAKIDVDEIVKTVLENVGYNKHCEIINNIGQQSNDIALGVDIGGAGDNGMMFGYACNETEQYLPKAMVILQEFAKEYDILRQKDKRFLSDGKAQITGIYNKSFKLNTIKTFTICYQNTELERTETDKIIINIAKNIAKNYGVIIQQFLINPTGRFLIGGFDGDAGLTGRKIVVDAYQSFANVGGGCMNGKDPSKVDISGAYKARQIALEYLKEFNLNWCEVQLSYAIGKKEPLAIYIDSNIGNLIPKDKLWFECIPGNIIKELKMLELDYEKQAQFGHFSEGGN